jgi:hypothetical protein
MRSFTATLCGIAAFAAAVLAAGNPITLPNGSETLQVGKLTTITWTPTSGDTVTLSLSRGSSDNLEDVIVLACKLIFWNVLRLGELIAMQPVSRTTAATSGLQALVSTKATITLSQSPVLMARSITRLCSVSETGIQGIGLPLLIQASIALPLFPELSRASIVPL